MKRNVKILLCLILTIFSATVPVYADSAKYVVFTEKNIKTEDMRKKSELDKKKLAEYIKKYPGLSGIEETLIEAQDEYKVNAILILAIVRLESGNGKSKIAQSRNNLGGIIVSEKSVRVYKSFDTRSDCVTYMAKLIGEDYLTEDGKYYNGYTLPDIAKRYSASSDRWCDLVKDLIYEIQTGIDKIAV
jgi:beta-N-acetylglucosaminidase